MAAEEITSSAEFQSDSYSCQDGVTAELSNNKCIVFQISLLWKPMVGGNTQEESDECFVFLICVVSWFYSKKCTVQTTEVPDIKEHCRMSQNPEVGDGFRGL